VFDVQQCTVLDPHGSTVKRDHKPSVSKFIRRNMVGLQMLHHVYKLKKIMNQVGIAIAVVLPRE